MGFRTNLLNLRSARGMSQAQLAMLVGVSRQSVTKWESDASYPEIEKLMTLCDIFGCTLDQLMREDLTDLKANPGMVVDSNAAPVDICGYEEHARRRSLLLPSGIALVVFSFGLASLILGIEKAMGVGASALSSLFLMIGIIVGVSFLTMSLMSHRKFRKEHPFIEDFYTPAERAEAHRRKAIGIVVGVSLVIIAQVTPALLSSVGVYELVCVFAWWLLVAAGIWAIVYAIAIASRVNVDRYNKKGNAVVGKEDTHDEDRIEESCEADHE